MFSFNIALFYVRYTKVLRIKKIIIYFHIDRNNEVKCIDDEIPFDILLTWTWVKLFTLGEIVGGGTPKTSIKEYWEKGTIPWLTPADMKFIKGKFVKKRSKGHYTRRFKTFICRLLPKDSIVFSSRAPIGYIAITKNQICTIQGFKSINLYKKNIKEYLYYSLIARTEDIVNRASGTTFKEISGTKFGETLIPLAPYKEQRNIIKKIEAIYFIKEKFMFTE